MAKQFKKRTQLTTEDDYKKQNNRHYALETSKFKEM